MTWSLGVDSCVPMKHQKPRRCFFSPRLSQAGIVQFREFIQVYTSNISTIW